MISKASFLPANYLSMAVLSQSKASSILLKPLKITVLNKFFFPPLPPPNLPLSKVSKFIQCAPLSSSSFILNTKVRSRHLAVQVKFPLQTSRRFQKRTLVPPPFLSLTLLSALLTKFKVSILPSALLSSLLPDIIIYFFLGHQVVVKLYSRVQPKIFFRHLAPPNLSQFIKFTVSPLNLIKSLKNAPFVSHTIVVLPVPLLVVAILFSLAKSLSPITAFFFSMNYPNFPALYLRLCVSLSKTTKFRFPAPKNVLLFPPISHFLRP